MRQVTASSIADIAVLEPGWKLSLRAQNKSAMTIMTYGYGVTQLSAYLGAQGMPTEVDKISREHIEAFLVAKREQTSSTTAETRYRGLRAFFRWLVEEGEITSSPMERMKPPKVGDVEVYVPTVADDDAMLLSLRKATVARWADRRDAAIISLFAGAGLRLSELTNLTVADIDIETKDKGGIVKVRHGKGDRFRIASFRPEVANDLARWLRVRMARPQAVSSDALWLGLKGPMTTSGIRQMLWKRSEAAGVPRLHPHQLRHHFASEWLRSGRSESGLMSLAGWKSRAMLDNVYAVTNRSERAVEEHLRD